MATIQCSACKGYNDPNETEICVHCGNPLVESERSSNSGKQELPESLSSIAGRPVLETWKTSIGMSILGAVCGFVFFMVLVLIVSGIQASYIGPGPNYIPSSSAGALAGPIASIVMCTLTLLYAAFYSTLFNKTPRIKSSKILSFTNLFFGGVLFGCLWNRNLTKSHAEKKRIKGSSWRVAIVLSIVAVLVNGWISFTVDAPMLERARTYNAAAVAGGYTDEETDSGHAASRQNERATFQGVTYILPLGWTAQDMTAESNWDGDLELRAGSSVRAEIFVGSDFSKAEFASLTAASVESEVAGNVRNWEREELSKIELGNYEYWICVGTGKVNLNGKKTEARVGSWITSQNDRMYFFLYIEDLSGTNSANRFDEFAHMIETAKYE